MPLARRPHGPSRRRAAGRAVVFVLPNGFTIANLFCGIFAIVLATRGQFSLAGTFIVLGGVADALDGRIARATNSGTRIGAELDSLVDAISFGFAPAMIMFFAVLNRENLSWLLIFFYTTCAVIRLARFNVEQAGRAKRYFHGLPSPAAGLTLATYYWFSQTPLYTQTMIANVRWDVALPVLMGVLSLLMISNVPYPAVPTVGYRSVREMIGSVVVVGTIFGLFFLPKEFFFPACIAYVAYGVIKSGVLGLLGLRETWDATLVLDDEPLDESPDDERRPAVALSSPPRLAVSSDAPLPPAPARRRRRRRPPRGDRPDRPDRPDRTDRSNPPDGPSDAPPPSPRPPRSPRTPPGE